MNYIIILLIMSIGHMLSWFSNNGQFLWESWKNNPLISIVLLGIPSSFAFWWATKIGYAEMGSVWSVRFLAFAASYFVFPFLTYFLLGESFLDKKTMVCAALSFAIIWVQISWE